MATTKRKTTKGKTKLRKEHVEITFHNGLMIKGHVENEKHISENLGYGFFEVTTDDNRDLIFNTDSVFMVERLNKK